MIKGASKPLLILAAGAVTAAGIGGYAWYESKRPAVLEVFIFDTPGSPSIFVRTPDDKRILIGGGSNADIVRRLTGILPFYSRRLDAIIAPDTDIKSVTGLIEVMNRYSVEKVFIPAVTLESIGLASSSDPAYAVFLETIRARAIHAEEFSAGAKLAFGQIAGNILFPTPADKFKYSKSSPPILCIRLSYGSASILLMGTTGTKTQKFVASSASTTPDVFPVSVLAISHGIAPGNIAGELLTAASPEYLVYSQAIQKSPKKSAANKKADPLVGILGNYRFNIREKGMVKIVSDGHSLQVI